MKKINNKILLLALAALAAIYFSLKFLRGSRDTNLPEALVQVDTAAVTEIKIYPKENNFEEIRLLREGQKWTVKEKDKTSSTDHGAVSSLLASFPAKPLQLVSKSKSKWKEKTPSSELGAVFSLLVCFPAKPLQLVSKSKSKWKEYQVSDTSTQVKLLKGSSVVADFPVGGIGFLPSQGQQFGAGNVFTYLRNSDDAKVYTVQGFLEPVFNKVYNDWRDKTFLKVNRSEITKVDVHYPLYSGFLLEKADKNGLLEKDMAASPKAASFLSQLENVRATKYQDEAPTGSPDITIQLFAGLNELDSIKAWRKENEWTMQSSQRSDVYFTSQGLEFLLKKSKELK